MARQQRAFTACLLQAVPPLLVLLAAAAMAPSAQAAVDRVSAEAEWPSGNPLVTPYADAAAGVLLLHLQPRDAGGTEQLIDARTGRRWSGSPAEVMARFTRLPVEGAAEVRAGRAWDQRLAHALGCAPPVTWCSSPADAELVLLLRADGRRLRLETIDLRGLLARMDELMAGRIDATAVTRDEQDWRLIELAAASPQRRQRWLDAVRSIDSAERWRRVKAAAEQGPGLLQWAWLRLGSGAATEGALDLAGELERSALRLHVARLARAAAAGAADAALRELADGLLLANQPGFRGDLASALVDVLLQLDPTERASLAPRLSAEAERQRSHGLWCYAEWMVLRPCGGTPVWETTPAPAPAAQPATPPATPTAPATPAGPPAPTPALGPSSPAPSPAGGARQRPGTPDGDAPQEWALLQTLPNKLLLLAYDEISGHLAPEVGAAAGLSFVARALGPVQDGRFELQVSPNARAPLQLRHGAYRVRVRLVLDYAREDRCRSGLLCLFAGSERYARTERRDLVFTLAPGNRFVERRRAEFGHLLPLAAGGSLRYESTLTQARLAVENVRFELL